MMGPVAPVALTAATLLARKALEAVGGKAGESGWAGLQRLAALIGRKASGHQRAEATLVDLDTYPDDPARVRAVAEALTLWVPDIRSPQAACAYSWISPPSRSRRTTLPAGRRTAGSPDLSGGICPKARCGRCSL